MNLESELETRILSPSETVDDSEIENPLRPQTLDNCSRLVEPQLWLILMPLGVLKSM